MTKTEKKYFVLCKKIDLESKRTCFWICNSYPLCGEILTRAEYISGGQYCTTPCICLQVSQDFAVLCESSESWPHTAEGLLYISYQGRALSSLMNMGVVCSNLIVSVVHFLPGVKGKATRKFTSWCRVLFHVPASRTMLSYLAATNFKYFSYIFSLLLCCKVPKACSASARTLTEEWSMWQSEEVLCRE